jgi:hypothetical protein
LFNFLRVEMGKYATWEARINASESRLACQCQKTLQGFILPLFPQLQLTAA